MGKKHRKPKVKMMSYGGGEELPIVKSKQGLFKKPEFYLADQKYDNLGHGNFVGQDTGKLEGPSQRAIKGKGKKAKNVRVHSEGGDPIFLQDTSPIQQKYSSQSGMESAVKRWKSPHKLTGDPDKSTFNYEDKNRAKTEKEKFGVTSKKGQEKKIAKEKKKADKEAYKKTDEYKEKRAKTTDTVQAVGRAMMAYAGLKPGEAGESAVDKLKKEKAKKPSEEAGKPKTDLHAGDSADVLEEEVVKVEKDDKDVTKTAAPKRRGDIEAMSSMMRKIKNPQGDGASVKTPKQRKISEKKYNRKRAKADKSKIKQTRELDYAHKDKRSHTESTIVPNKRGTKNFVHEATVKSTYHPGLEMNIEDSRKGRYYKQRKK